MQNPGLQKKLLINMFLPNEQQITYNLSKLWFITFAKNQRFGDNDYSFIFAKPTNKVIEAFHFTREILIIFSPYPKFLSKTLDIADNILEEHINRLDKLCVIIVSNDNEIEDKVNNITSQDKDSKILIPFTYTELKEKNDTNLTQMNRLKKYFYSRNLFSYDTPLKNETYFFGRQTIIQDLYGKYQTGQFGSLFGLRRIGKTSSLFAVTRMMKIRKEPFVYIDCSETSFHKRRWNESLHFIITELYKTLPTDINIKLTPESKYTEKDASIYFEKDLTKIYKAFSKKRILIILDEIESITFDIAPTPHWKDGSDFISFWQALRSIFQKQDKLFSFIIAGVNPKSIETATVCGYDNPIYRYITSSYLPFFETKDVRSMVSTIGSYMGLKFDDEVYTYLTDDFGGHPFLIRQVCSKLFQEVKHQQKPFCITKFFYNDLREKLNRDVIDYLDLIINVLEERYPDEYDMIIFLANKDYKSFMEFIDFSQKYIDHLIGYGLIKEENDHYYFKIKSIENHIKEKSNMKKATLKKNSYDNKGATSPSPSQVNITNNYHAPMQNTQIQNAPLTSNQQQSIESSYENINTALSEINYKIDKLQLDEIDIEELKSEIETVKIQINSPKPKEGIIKEGLSSIRTILESATGKVVAQEAIDFIKNIL